MAKSKEELTAQRKAHYDQHKQEVLAQNKAYREKNKEKIAAIHQAYREKHRERLLGKNRHLLVRMFRQRERESRNWEKGRVRRRCCTVGSIKS